MFSSECSRFRQLLGVVVGGEASEEPTWYTASRCDNGQCVEIGIIGEFVLLRSSVDPDGACLRMSRSEWRDFVAGLKDGNFDGLRSPVRRPSS